MDLDAIATAFADQIDYDRQWLVDPRMAEVVFWTSDTGIDGQNPVDLHELDMIPIDPLPSHVWYGDMADFARGISDAWRRAAAPCARGARSVSTVQERDL